VDQNYVRDETLMAANNLLVAAHSRIPLAQAWGGGDVASADGMRFVVPVRTIHAGPNPKYFNRGRGVTWYNLLSDQGTGLNAITVPGTLRDSLVLLSVVLEQQTELQPTQIMTDICRDSKSGQSADVVELRVIEGVVFGQHHDIEEPVFLVQPIRLESIVFAACHCRHLIHGPFYAPSRGPLSGLWRIGASTPSACTHLRRSTSEARPEGHRSAGNHPGDPWQRTPVIGSSGKACGTPYKHRVPLPGRGIGWTHFM
jgi:hypothetical protein